MTDGTEVPSQTRWETPDNEPAPRSSEAERRGARRGDSAPLEALLHARSVAVIGASRDPRRLGGRPVDLLYRHGYEGRVYAINPNWETADQVHSYPSILEVPEPVEAALVMVRAELVPGVLRDCATAQVRVAVVVSSGFGEGQGAGDQLRAEIKELLSSASMRVIGPNCEGVFSAPNRMPLTFSPVMDHIDGDGLHQAGELAVVSQSGGLGFAFAQWAGEVGLPTRYVITTGNELDVGAQEVVAYLLEDVRTKFVVLIFEGLPEPEALIELSDRAKDLGKTLVVAKLGTSEPGRRAALAHTLHHSGHSGAYEELFSLGRLLRADDLQDVVHVVQAHARSHRLRGRKIAVVGTSGGAGVRVADACHAAGLEVPELSRATQERLRSFMPGFGSPANPVDLSAQFFFAGGSFAPVVEVLAESNEVDGVVIATSLTSPTRLELDKDALPAVIDRFQLPLLVYSYTMPADACRKLMESRRLAWYVRSSAVGTALASLASSPGDAPDGTRTAEGA